MSSSQTSADASRNRRRSRYFLVNSLADRLEEDSGQAKADVSIEVANRAKVPLPEANLQPSSAEPLTPSLLGGAGTSSLNRQGVTSQGFGVAPAPASSASARLVEGLMAEFQAVGLLPRRGSGDPQSPPPEPDILPQDWTVDAPQAPSLEQAEAIYDFDETDLFDASDLFEEVSGLDELEAIAAFDALAQLAQQERAPVQAKPFEINASQISAPEIPAPEIPAPESTIPESTIPESIAPESIGPRDV
ncbi:MAG: hypothetical protein HC771_09015 [Synechococcales cyanobacterium CRU_2_2]|nr:hypothetical protein [Synechococcales cyanobacterium CRU_2_2]